MSITKKDGSLDGLRGIACLVVFSSHFFYLAFPYLQRARWIDQSIFQPAWPWEVWFGRAPFTLIYNGDLAVLVFFVLSGFVLMRKHWQTGDRISLLTGALKRYPRLVLPVAGSVLFALALMKAGLMDARALQDFPSWSQQYALLSSNVDVFWRQQYSHAPDALTALRATFISVLSLHDDATLSRWNSPLWSINIELLASISLFAVYFVFGDRKLLAGLALVALGFAAGMPLYFAAFAIGASLNGATKWLKSHQKVSAALFVAGLAIGLFDYSETFKLMAAVVPPGYNRRAFWYLFAASFVLAGTIGSRQLTRFFSHKICAYFGRISFSLYILHWPLLFSFSIWTIKSAVKMDAPYLVACLCAYLATLLLVVALSEVFYRNVDARAVRLADWLADRLIKRRRASSAHPIEVGA
ncbi:acyltransferase family protein [Cupriavidus sp. 2KB_3]|uniref:acyltransferase family protein n=1 Tax=Cupriavidus TaxID=106589 RepID=UPI0011EFBAFA|nr:acyltransferase [Cupriavidus campinensis]